MYRISLSRGAATLAAIILATGIYRLGVFSAPQASKAAILALSLAGFSLATLFAYAASDRALRAAAPYLGLGVAATWVAPCFGAASSLLFGFVSLGGLIAIAASAFRDLGRLIRAASRAEIAFALIWSCALLAFSAYLIIASRDLMWSDFMICRLYALQVAQAIRAGQGLAMLAPLVRSFSSEYSLVSAVAPAFVMAVGGPLSRAAYQAGITLAYAAPAFLAMGLWSREIARRAGVTGDGASDLAIAVVFIGVAAPAAMTIVARGMPDIGGLVLMVWALYLVEGLCGAAEKDEPDEAEAMRAATQLAGCLFMLFLFRRWYLFGALGVVASFGLELIGLALTRRGRFPWRIVSACGALAGLVLLALAAPVVVDWLPEWKSHDYISIYAGYNYDWAELTRRLGVWYGHAILALAVLSAAFVGTRNFNNRPLRLTLIASVAGFGLQVYVQSPSLHHTYLIVPAIAISIGACAIFLLHDKPKRAAGAALALGACTLTPLAAAFPLQGWLPTLSLAEAPRSDLAELSRLRDWTDSHATPDRRYCVLASSLVVSGVLLDELWQLNPARPPITHDAGKNDIILPQVDARDGPPNANLKDCAFLLVADPVQTSLNLDFQLSVAIPAREILSGQGLGMKFRRTGDAFNLIDGVKLIAFERTSQVTDTDISELVARWRAAPRGDVARRAAKGYL